MEPRRTPLGYASATMTTSSHWADRLRRGNARATAVAGFAIILLAAGAALLPAEKGISSDVLGGLLLGAGLIEMVAGALRRETRILAMGAGGITAAAGLMFLLNSDARFFPTV